MYSIFQIENKQVMDIAEKQGFFKGSMQSTKENCVQIEWKYLDQNNDLPLDNQQEEEVITPKDYIDYNPNHLFSENHRYSEEITDLENTMDTINTKTEKFPVHHLSKFQKTTSIKSNSLNSTPRSIKSNSTSIKSTTSAKPKENNQPSLVSGSLSGKLTMKEILDLIGKVKRYHMMGGGFRVKFDHKKNYGN